MADKSTDEVTKNSEATKRLERSIKRFVHRIEGIKRAEEIVIPLVGAVSKKADSAFSDFLDHEGIEAKKEGSKTTFTIPVKKVNAFEDLQRKKEALDSAFFQTPRALLVALVSSYDAYLGDLLRATFYMRPELLNTSNRTLGFSELVALGSIEQAREYLIEKEVESVVRESHSKHFDWMESRFSVSLRKGLDSWPSFIELTERRNLFVHTDGVVSSQYVNVCEANKVDLTNVEVGKRLGVNASYFQNAFECLFEIGVKLGQVLWRKLAAEDLKSADEALNDVCFDLLVAEQYRLAERLLHFTTDTLKKHHSNLTRRIFIMNLAIAYKWQEKEDQMSRILDSEDWSDCGDNFKLALAVLKNDFSNAERLMRELGREAKGIGRIGYETWPLFRSFRKSDQFLSAFKAIYGEDFEIQTEATPESKEKKDEA